MVSQDEKGPSEGKQFRLVKFFAWASFVVLVLFSFPFSMFLSQQAKEILLTSYENSALLVGENLNHQVFRNFVVPVTRRYGKITLREEEQYELMDQVVRNTIHGFNVDLVNIYAIGQGVIAYSTDPKLIGLKAKDTEGYRKAILGENFSGLASLGDELWGLDINIIGGQKKIRTYIPFRGMDPYTGRSYVGGVFELIQDASEEYRAIVRFQYLVVGLSILIMGLIFLALLLIVHKAETIIRQRAEEQRQLESQLHQAERLATLGEMVAGVSHEIKNPLGIIHSTAELLGGMSDSNESQKRLAGVITEESDRLNRIVTEFLDFARPQEPNLQECRLGEIIQKNILFLSPELERKGIAIEDNVDGRPMEMRADPGLLYRAFLNILINAIQSTEGGGRIDINVQEDPEQIRVTFSDTGCGIDRETLKKIFNPFFTTKDKGTGLGLSIVRKIVEGHGGSIAIESARGEGTRVKIALPRAIP